MRVCILGGGLSSLTLAKALVNQNIYVDLISQKQPLKINKTRTIGISKSNVEFFNKNIININKIIWKIKKIEIFSDNLKNEKILDFKNKYSHIFSIVKNFKLYEVLEKSLLKNKYFNKIKINKKKNLLEEYNLVINTDYNNLLTKKYFHQYIEKKYNSRAYTTILKHQRITNDVATQIFTKKGPIAFLPISNMETSVVYSVYNSINNNEDIKKSIHNYNIKYKISKINKIENFELKALNLRSYYHKNILAFGDLLHKIHPLAGQGFNMTIRDITFLLKIISNKKILGLPLDQSINYEFEKNVKHKNFIFSNGIDLINEFFNFERKTNISLLSKSVKILGNNFSVNEMFRKIADKGINF